MSEQEYRVRECVHRARGAAGEYYRGSSYVKHLQRLRTADAMTQTVEVDDSRSESDGMTGTASTAAPKTTKPPAKKKGKK